MLPALARPAHAGTGGQLPTAGLRELVDDTGARVLLPARPARVVALAPDLAETVVDLGAEAALVGACEGCDTARDPPPARVGPMFAPGVERILALEPDLVLATSQGNPRATVDRLRELGVPVFGVSPTGRGLEGVSRQLLAVGLAMGLDAEGRRLAADFDAAIAAVRSRSAGRPRLRACWLVWTSPLIAAGRTSYLDDVLDAVGADNACATGDEEYPRLSRETLLLAAPELILLTVEGEAGLDGAWAQELPAVRQRRVLRLPPDELLRPTLRLARAVERLERRLRPDPAATP